MGQVYHNSYCNIGAHAAAENPSAGLFVDRNPLQISVAVIPIERKEFQGTGHSRPDKHHIASSPLMHRGWVFQERLLSPRSIYFGKTLNWECSEHQACEVFPNSRPIEATQSPWRRQEFPLRASNLLYDSRYRDATNKHGRKPIEPPSIHFKGLHRKWLQVVEYFTLCALTFESDCFPAISGLAQYFQEALQDEYLAGVWRNDILNGLLWYYKPLKTERKLEVSRGMLVWAGASKII